MNRRIPVLSLGLSVFLAALRAETTAAQTSPSSQDVQLYVGEMFGDRLMQTPFSSSTPRLGAYGQGLNTAETTLSLGYHV